LVALPASSFQFRPLHQIFHIPSGLCSAGCIMQPHLPSQLVLPTANQPDLPTRTSPYLRRPAATEPPGGGRDAAAEVQCRCKVRLFNGCILVWCYQYWLSDGVGIVSTQSDGGRVGQVQVSSPRGGASCRRDAILRWGSHGRAVVGRLYKSCVACLVWMKNLINQFSVFAFCLSCLARSYCR